MTLSIVIPAYNEEKIIEGTLAQIKNNLTAIDYELIVSDHGSSDRTAELARRYATVTIFNGTRTIAANRNNGARSARGEFIAFIDADILVPDPNVFFPRLIAHFEKDKNLVGATVKIKVRPEEAKCMDGIMMWFANASQWFNNSVRKKGGASGEFQMVRRSAFEALGGYNEALAIGEDADFFMRLRSLGRTMIDMHLAAYTHRRRLDALGWPKLLWLWVINYIYITLFGHSYSKEWPPKRKKS